MVKIRRRHSAAYEFRVALEGSKTIGQLPKDPDQNLSAGTLPLLLLSISCVDFQPQDVFPGYK